METSGEVEADDLVERGEGFGVDLVEHASGDPLVATSPQGGVGDLEVKDRFDVDPRCSGDESDQDPTEAEPV